MISVPDAVARALSVYPRLGSERVALSAARGRRLAAAFRARFDVPPFDASAMDGYAVLARDLAHASEASPTLLLRVDEVRAGGTETRSVLSGQAVRVFTGAPVPAGADAVLIQEDATALEQNVSCRYASRPGQHIRHRGSDIEAGSGLLEALARLEGGEIAVLASQEVSAVDVVRRPIVAIVSTGDELREVGEPNRPGSIVGSNAWMLAALVEREGGVPRVLAPVRDEPEAIARALRDALDADVVLTTGGVSVGDYDHVPAVMAQLGIETVFAKVRMKPGKPVVVARRAETPVIGLPGNPASALVGFELFVAPGLRRMQGDETPFPSGVLLPLEAEHRRSPGRPELARGRTVVSPDGETVLRLTGAQGSAALRSLLAVDCLALFGAQSSEIPRGQLVFTLPLGARGVLGVSPLAGRPELHPDSRV